MRPIDTLLIANRGEIARRVTRTARRMGLSVVAVYAEPDADAPFVREADRAVPLGGTTSEETYLDVDKLLDAAHRTGADAVHPGYGFLAESAGFARAVVDAGLTWVGPSADAIAAMGDKLTALAAMERAGVPTLPRADASGLDGDELIEAGREVGYPLMVKAAAGGGGKGMRIVAEEAGLTDAVAAARRESGSAFGDDTVFLERFVSGGRHIEVQILGDSAGTVRHLFERECSIQRRHQKIVEEAPSPFVSDELRSALCDAGVAAGRAVAYEGAGTVEFIVGDDGGFYFLEMNTRLQVEHPVTELITGVDLVRQQLLIAQGLPMEVVEPTIDGAAIEVRLYAEDPANEFLPQTGQLVRWEEPGDGIRVDTGVETGSEVSPYFDPMLAKLMAWAPDRREASRRLAGGLRRLGVQGLTTNRDFLVSILRHPAFLDGDTTVDFIELHQPARTSEPDPATVRRAAISAALADRAAFVAAPPYKDLPPTLPPGWRNNRSQGETTRYLDDGDAEVVVDFWQQRDGSMVGTVDDHAFQAVVRGWSDPRLDVEIDGERFTVTVIRDGARVWLDDGVGEVRLVERPRFPLPEVETPTGGLTATMNGTVQSVHVAPGDEVSAGDPVVVLEAMKMEHRVVAPFDGTVSEVLVSPGDIVPTDALLAVIDEAGQADEAEDAEGPVEESA